MNLEWCAKSMVTTVTATTGMLLAPPTASSLTFINRHAVR
jgi:hypothetical protein